MIGHALLSFSPEQEDRVLTEAMRPLIEQPGNVYTGGPCLLMTAKYGDWSRHLISLEVAKRAGQRFDALCHRFGTIRVTTAIRNRILTNRLWRELKSVESTTPEPTYAQA